MGLFPVCWRFKRTHLAALGIDLREDMANRTVLAARIHPLQHHEQAMILRGCQQLLQLTELCTEYFQFCLC